ncbi:flavodoxin family protein [Alkaliphilus peptidifermentans]|uniref:Flavodoxin domain-containing protein n=1 Tax=Alkaliphilus peptidifermentans DSM 18978 TaxID=1120976 RepID=A0A1G5H161_9FIRM|nr:flavodoxin family protein [Alkaliphilus peptidifermentans]SCY56648.1 Flavodoxin domain-containing protein [Alkaliphilus peptidifermentans DSM 18978]
MQKKPRILILYHSGAGSTKTLAEIFYEKLSSYTTEISSISTKYDYNKLNEYDFIILAYPTYHCEPSLSMKEFIMNMPKLPQEKRAFVFTTCGLYSGNSVRSFIKESFKKNLVTCASSVYKAPATDGALLLPLFAFMFKY